MECKLAVAHPGLLHLPGAGGSGAVEQAVARLRSATQLPRHGGESVHRLLLLRDGCELLLSPRKFRAANRGESALGHRNQFGWESDPFRAAGAWQSWAEGEDPAVNRERHRGLGRRNADSGGLRCCQAATMVASAAR